MKKGVVSVLLYLIVIIISIILGFQEHVLLGFMWIGFAGLSYLAGYLITNWGIKKNPGMHQSFSLNYKEHIIMPILYLLIIFSGNIIWLISPEIGNFMISINSIYLAIAVPFSSMALSEIFVYTRFHPITDDASDK